MRKEASAAELAKVLQVTAADVRHHLTSLEDEGVISVVGKIVQGRGRPAQLYKLRVDINRHNLETLTNAIFYEWLGRLVLKEQDSALNNIASRILEGYRDVGGNFTQRIARANRHLNEMNYSARWEAHIDAPRILITHCPYGAVAMNHPEICRLDVFLIQKMLGTPVAQLVNPDRFSQSDIKCIFRIDIHAPGRV
jgi:predicted ArsR family transcriptional regulator